MLRDLIEIIAALPKAALFSEDSIGSLYIAEWLRTALTLLASVYNLFKALVSLFDISFNSHNCIRQMPDPSMISDNLLLLENGNSESL